jgi:YVTN family beta-propeller protein
MNWAISKRQGSLALVALAVFAIALLCASGADSRGKKHKKKPAAAKVHTEILFAGNNWDGTADVLKLTAPAEPAKCRKKAKKKKNKAARRKAAKRCRKAAKKPKKVAATEPVDLKRIGRINIIPDFEQRMAEIMLNPVRLAYFLLIREQIGEGHDQFVDDMYSSRDGELLIVSRPSFADVVAISIRSRQIVWRFPVAGQRSDHMALSPDGRHVAVSASTANVVHILDIATGNEVGRFDSGDSPHENTYSADGKRIYHASIGLVYTPLDQPTFDSTKGKRYFQVVDAQTGQIIKRVDMGQKLAEAGYPGMSSAVRPMAITKDERFAYLQVSFFHGFAEYDLQNDAVRRVANLPIPPEVQALPREQYLLDSAHHGIALNGANSELCVAGTMSDYAAIVSRRDFTDFKLIRAGEKPYWSTTSEDGRYCFVSWSGSDRVSVISYADRKEVARIQVGDHPQRIRTGHLASGALRALRGR